MTTPGTPEGPTGVPAGAPPGARFDPVTGADLRVGAGGERRDAFALQPGEPVASFNMVTSLMPLASGAAPQTYRWALALGLLIPVVAGALGYLAFAFVAAALLVPAIYIVYMYDVNQWEDQPLPVVLGAVGVAAALGVGFTYLWHAGLLGGEAAPVDFGEGTAGIRWTSLLVLVLLVPIVSEALKQVGPLFLATRPRFDDMIDALTFGVAAGAAYAAAETIVVNRELFSSFGHVDNADAGFWVSLILSAAIVKPIVYGAATGIALAAWSGLGSGYDGFKPGYVRGLAEAVLANIVFQAGLFFSARLEGTTGAVVGLVWGALVAAVLVVRLRYLLHFAVLESALEASSSGAVLKDSARGTAFCPSCEMPLAHGANFCVVCGTATRAGSKVTRLRNRTDDEAVDGATARKRPALAHPPAGVAPRDNKKTAVVVGSVVAAIVLGGVVAQAAASAAEDAVTDETVIDLQPQLGTGPQTEDPPEQAPAPGPEPDPSESPAALGTSLESSGTAAFLGSGTGAALPAASTTTEPNPDGDSGATTGQSVDLGNGIGFEVAEGFEVVASEPGFAQVFGEGGYFVAYLTPTLGPAGVNELVANNIAMLEGNGIQELQIRSMEDVQVPSSAVVSALRLGYTGIWASQQNGSTPVQVIAYYFRLQDGSGVTAFGLFGQGAITGDSHPLAVGYTTMLNSLVSTF